jgi:hypothetical protein
LQIFNKPLLDLINVLGLELPVAPEVSLVGIKSDQVTLHWNRPTAQNTVVKHFIQVNGINGNCLSPLFLEGAGWF